MKIWIQIPVLKFRKRIRSAVYSANRKLSNAFQIEDVDSKTSELSGLVKETDYDAKI